jgi:uracil-DNA glycosylase family 4
MTSYQPERDCPLCPRLCAFRATNRQTFPDKHNAPVPSFGPLSAELLVVGLAPGLKGANFSGRPFTGDYAGVLLYQTLLKFGFASGVYEARADDSLTLLNARITNAVRCVPPENKPTPEEMRQCLPFLSEEIAQMKNLKILVTLGLVSHQSTLRALGERPSSAKFAHGAQHKLPSGHLVINSYHCSRYNTQTNRLTETMFHDVFAAVKDRLKSH